MTEAMPAYRRRSPRALRRASLGWGIQCPDRSGGDLFIVAILWAILVIVLVVWLIGLLADVAGTFIHLLLIVALIILIYNLIIGRRSV